MLSYVLLCLHSSLARALQPSVLMQMKLSDGSFQRFEVSQNQLHADCEGSFTFHSKHCVLFSGNVLNSNPSMQLHCPQDSQIINNQILIITAKCLNYTYFLNVFFFPQLASAFDHLCYFCSHDFIKAHRTE